ncbi:hypothetical protein KZZ07_19560 [Mameliella sp. CS4]|uniref:hypothetical protein n=1 Tax=Mameliella sp. CS4 TaxID=2862329 RepID=UPI001C5FA200|nr:hypothetical protein [Mameliella sp. CS4]MBW4984743.1 hypothetical protein [Mameliella sp. CS4]
MTREELDARAAELGISTSSRWKDETVAEKIAEAEAEQAGSDTTPEGTSDGPGPVEGAGERAAPTQSAAEEDQGSAPVAKAAAAPQEVAKPAVPDPEQPPEGVLTVIGPKRGRWRAGRHFSPEPVKIPLAELSDDEIAMLANDPKLTLSGLPQD